MNICAVCFRALREGEVLRTEEVPGLGMVPRCGVCRGEAERTYPPGSPVPASGDRQIRVCGLCRRALRHSDSDQCVRVATEDLGGFVATEPGVYMACPECLEIVEERLLYRLVGQGVLPPGTLRLPRSYRL